MTVPIEFERKFLLRQDALAELLKTAHGVQDIRQGYFMEDEQRCVRVRNRGDAWLLTFKARTQEVGKLIEVEMPVESSHAETLMALSQTRVHKRRHLVQHGEFLWEVDEFLDHNAGLVLAEVELADDVQSDRLSAALPAWVEREVTGQPQYFNTWLAANTLPRP